MPSITVNSVVYELPPDDSQAQKVSSYNAAIMALAGESANGNKWARAYHNTTQSITTATVTALSLNSEHYDTDTIHDLVTNNSRLTCKTAGIYEVIGMVGFAANATGWRASAIRLNGTTYLAQERRMNIGAADAAYLQVVTRWPLIVNDYIELMVEQTSGGALSTVRTANVSCEFMMTRIGA